MNEEQAPSEMSFQWISLRNALNFVRILIIFRILFHFLHTLPPPALRFSLRLFWDSKRNFMVLVELYVSHVIISLSVSVTVKLSAPHSNKVTASFLFMTRLENEKPQKPIQ